MMNMLAFYNKRNNEKLAAISINEIFEGEVESTKELLAYENGINVEDVETKEEVETS